MLELPFMREIKPKLERASFEGRQINLFGVDIFGLEYW